MKNILRVLFAASLATTALLAADATGKWTAEMQGRGGNTMTVTMKLKADGAKLTGTVSGRNGDTEITDGKVDGDQVMFSVVREYNGNKMTQNYTGKLEGDTIHFTIKMEGGMGNMPDRKFDAKRAGD
jgi:hypothetical protein